MNLVIIEGVGKKDTIKKYLGADFEVVATKGHVRDLPVKSLGINVIENFKPLYEIMPDKSDIVKMLKTKQEKASKIYLATDPDREGEAISWHLCNILDLNPTDPIRIFDAENLNVNIYNNYPNWTTFNWNEGDMFQPLLV